MSALIAHRGLVLTGNIDDYPEGIIIPIDKPYRWTSADVIRKVKYQAIKHFSKKNLKVGHAGTLDPLATGVLLVCIGKATKLAEELQRSPKQYLAGVTFGATTPSYDLEKEIDREYPLDNVSEESVRDVLKSFIGEQDQVAPLFSAKSVDGVRAYETARKLLKQGRLDEGSDILQASRITIYDLQLDSFLSADGPWSEAMASSDAPRRPCETEGRERQSGRSQSEIVPRVARFSDTVPSAGDEQSNNAKSGRIHVADISGYNLPTAMVRVDCSKGTYIRALARDLGEALDSGAFLSSLRRTKNGGIAVEDSLSLDDTAEMLKIC